MSSHTPCTTPHLIAAIVSAVQAGEDHDLGRLLAGFASSADASAAFALRRALLKDLRKAGEHGAPGSGLPREPEQGGPVRPGGTAPVSPPRP